MHARPFSCWLKRLLAAAALAIALSPLPVSAHGGHDHGSPAAKPASQAAPPAHGWSSSCPGDSGGACCCGKTGAFPGSARASIVNARGWVVFVQPFEHALQALPRGTLLSRPLPRLVLPRAPPFLS